MPRIMVFSTDSSGGLGASELPPCEEDEEGNEEEGVSDVSGGIMGSFTTPPAAPPPAWFLSYMASSSFAIVLSFPATVVSDLISIFL